MFFLAIVQLMIFFLGRSTNGVCVVSLPSAGHNGLHGIFSPGWYEGYLVGGHPRTTSFADIKPLDYPDITQKIEWHKIRVTPTPGDLSRTIKLGSPSKVVSRKRLCDLSRVYDFDKHIDHNDDEIVDSSSEEEEANYEEGEEIVDQKGDGYEDYMTKFRVNNIKRIHVIKPSDLIDELTGHEKEDGKKFLPQPKGKDPYTKRNVYGFQRRMSSVNKNLRSADKL